ncbi:MAG: acyl carrier protein [Gammaproteobacteria bacterium]|nr:acyl carrier protein [Gammaproteobacteria bacterium]
MKRQGEVRSMVLTELARIAPEVVEQDLDPARPLRDQIDLDSIDWLNLIIGLHEAFCMPIPEVDYARLVSLNDVVAYVCDKREGGPQRPSA